MTQHAVERTIGKLVTDAGFRARFFSDPAAASWEAGLSLSPAELEALAALSYAALTRLSQRLDPRIRRLCPDTADARRQAEPATGDDDGTNSTASP
jgi:hypothetical protein